MKDRIKKVRNENNLNMARFAERLGVSQPTVSLWESGQRAITPQIVRAISREFNVSEEWLTTGEGEMNLPATKAMKAAEIADKYLHENSNVKNELIGIVSDMDESLLKLLVKEAKRLYDAMEKDQE